MPVTASVGNGGASDVLAAYRDQISTLEKDPNATQAFKAALEQQFDAVKQQAETPGGDTSGSATPSTPAMPQGAALTPSVPAPASPVAPQPDLPAGGTSLDARTLPPALQRLAPLIEQASKTTGESATLIAAQIWQESRGVSSSSTVNAGTGQSDAGLMQVDAATFGELQQKHPELQGKSLGDDLVNITAGAFYTQDLKQQFGSDDLALRAYNSGPLSVDRSDANKTTTGLGDPTYVTKVDAFAQSIAAGTALPA